MPEATVPGDRQPKMSFDEVVDQLKEMKEQNEEASNDNSELLLDIQAEIEKQGSISSGERGTLNTILQYQTEMFGQMKDLASATNKGILDQLETQQELFKVTDKMAFAQRLMRDLDEATRNDEHQDQQTSLKTIAETSTNILNFLQAAEDKRDAAAREAAREGAGAGKMSPADVKKEAKKGGLIGGIFGAIGGAFSMIGGIFKAISKVGPKFVLGMSSLGAGIAGFFVGFAMIGEAMQFATSAGEGVVKVMKNFFDAFNGVGVEGLVAFGAILTAGVITSKLGGMNQLKLMSGMTALGMGISGFFLGIMAGDFIAKLGDAAGIDGSSMKKLIQNVFGAFDGVKETATLFAIMGAGAVVALGKKGMAKKIALGMTAVGAGITGFASALLAGDFIVKKLGKFAEIPGESIATLLKTVFGAFEGISETTLIAVMGTGAAVAALKVGPKQMIKGMGALAAGIIAFAGTFVAADALLAGVDSLFKGVKIVEGIKNLDTSIMKIGVKSFTDAFTGSLISAATISAVFAGGIAIAKLNIGAGKIVKGMGSLAAGIMAFAGVFTGGSAILNKILPELDTGEKDMSSLDPKAMKKMVQSVFGALSDINPVTLAGIITAGALIPMSFPVKMGLLGAGLIAFTTVVGGIGEILGKIGIDGTGFRELLGNIGGALGDFAGGAINWVEPLSKVDGSNLVKVGLGMTAIAGALAVFTAGAVADSIVKGGKALFDGIKGFFGGKDPDEIEDPLDALGPLKPFAILANRMPENFATKMFNIGQGMQGIADAFLTFSEGKIKSGIGNILSGGDFDPMVKMMNDLSMDSINPDKIRSGLMALADGLAAVGTNQEAISNLMKNPVRLPESTMTQRAMTDEQIKAFEEKYKERYALAGKRRKGDIRGEMRQDLMDNYGFTEEQAKDSLGQIQSRKQMANGQLLSSDLKLSRLKLQEKQPIAELPSTAVLPAQTQAMMEGQTVQDDGGAGAQAAVTAAAGAGTIEMINTSMTAITGAIQQLQASNAQLLSAIEQKLPEPIG